MWILKNKQELTRGWEWKSTASQDDNLSFMCGLWYVKTRDRRPERNQGPHLEGPNLEGPCVFPLGTVWTFQLKVMRAIH